MNTGVTVTLIKVVQIRHEYEFNGKKGGYNKKYQRPAAAAEDWASVRNHTWNEKTFGHHSNMTSDDIERSWARYHKLVRRVTPIFKRLLA